MTAATPAPAPRIGQAAGSRAGAGESTPTAVGRAHVGDGGVIDMPIRPMTADEHHRQRDLVAASLLIIGEIPRQPRELAVDPGTYTVPAVVRRHIGMLNPGELRRHSTSTDRTLDARSL